MNGFRRGVFAVVTSMVLVVMGVVALPPAAQAAMVFTPLAVRFSANANGSIVTVGNGVITCPPSTGCAQSQTTGEQYRRDVNRTAVYVDADSDPSTFDSSMSALSLPAGASVLWAGLYWQGYAPAATTVTNQMSLQAPGDSGYRTITADAMFGATAGSGLFLGFADVTELVGQSGSGDYWGANVATGVGWTDGMYSISGWALTVVYTAPGLPLRNLTVSDGYASTSAGAVEVTVPGIETPLSGLVTTQVSMIVANNTSAFNAETLKGSQTRLGDTVLATAASPADSFFNSVIDMDGVSYPDRTPAYANQMGFNIKNLTVTGAIDNGATSATLQVSANDTLYVGMVALATDLYAPDFSPSVKTAVDLDGHSPAQVGDIVQYTVRQTNIGLDAADQVMGTDRLPQGTQYVPGSLALLAGEDGQTVVPLTDQLDDDVGEFIGSMVHVQLGDGADGTIGGRINPGDTVGYTFKVRLAAETAGQTVTNTAQTSFITAAAQLLATYTITPVSLAVAPPADLQITKTLSPDEVVAGETVTATLVIVNNGPSESSGIEVTDPLVRNWSELTTDLTAAPGADCAVSPTSGLACTLPDMAAAASATIVVSGKAPTAASGSLVNLAQVAAVTYDSDTTNNVSSDSTTVTRQADLSVTQTPASPTVTPGTEVTYALTVTNSGPSDAANVVVTDLAGDGLALVGATAGTPGMTCQVAGPASCSLANLAAGQSATVTVVAQLASGTGPGATINNTATVTSATPDPRTSNNSSSSNGTAGPASADVRLAAAATPNPAVPGAQITYTLTATNSGPSDATAVAVSVPLPSSVTATSAVADRGSCVINDGVVACQLGDLAAGPTPGTAGAAATIVIGATLGADATAAGITATATAAGADPDRTNNTATASPTITSQAALSVTQTADTMALPDAQDPVTYAITIHNTGPSTARRVTLSEVLPAGLVIDSANPAQLPDQVSCSDSGNVWTCVLGDMNPDETATLLLHTVAVQPGTGTLVATASVSSDTAAPPGTASPTTASWTLGATAQSDLSVTMTAPDSFTAGQTGTYQLVVLNTGGTSTATVTDQLPDGLALIPAGSGSTSPECTASGQTVTCSNPTELAAGQTWNLTLAVAVSPDLADGTMLANTAQVTGSAPDPTTSNNYSRVDVPLVARAALAVSSVQWQQYDATTGLPGAAVTTAVPGSYLWLTTTLVNSGVSTARDVSVVLDNTAGLVVPDGGPLVSWNGAAAVVDTACAVVGGEVSCPVVNGSFGPAIPSGGTVTMSVLLALPSAAQPATGVGSVHAATTTPGDNLSDNDGQRNLAVGAAQTDVVMTSSQVAGSGSNGGVVAGQPFSYTIQVGQPQRDDGYWSDAGDVTVTNTLPDGFHATSWSATQGSCTIDPADDVVVSCALGTVAGTYPEPVTPVAITIFGTVDTDTPDLTAPISTTITAASQGPQSYVSAVDVDQTSDLQLMMAVDATGGQTPDGTPVVVAGTTVTYLLTTLNGGPSAAGPFTITDTLPVGLSLDSTSSPGCTVAVPGDPAAGTAEVVTCAVGGLEAGQSQQVHLVAATAGSDPRPRALSNTATISVDGSSRADPDTSNNTASATAELAQRADMAVTLAPSTPAPGVGQDLSYTVTAVNNGPSVATAPYLDLVFPAGFVIGSWDLPGASCMSGQPGHAVYDLRCTPDGGVLLPGQAISGSVVAGVPSTATPTSYLVTASVGTTAPDSDSSNNSAQAAVVPVPVSDIMVTAALASPAVVAGEQAAYQLTARNNGPSAAADATLSFALPAGLGYLSAGGAACSVPAADQDEIPVVICQIGALAVGDSTTIAMVVQADRSLSETQICPTVTAGSDSLDPVAGNNQASVCQMVGPPLATDVRVALTADQPVVAPGGATSFTAVVSNNGPGTSHGLSTIFDLPGGLSNVSGVLVTSSDGTAREAACVQSDQQLTCTIGDLAPGQSVTYRIAAIATGAAGSQRTITVANLPTDEPVAATVRIEGQPAPDTTGTLATETPATDTQSDSQSDTQSNTQPDTPSATSTDQFGTDAAAQANRAGTRPVQSATPSVAASPALPTPTTAPGGASSITGGGIQAGDWWPPLSVLAAGLFGLAVIGPVAKKTK